MDRLGIGWWRGEDGDGIGEWVEEGEREGKCDPNTYGPEIGLRGDTDGLVSSFLLFFGCILLSSSSCIKALGDSGDRGAEEVIESESGGGGALRVVRPINLLNPNPGVVFSFSSLLCSWSENGGSGTIDAFIPSSCSRRLSFSINFLPLDKNPHPIFLSPYFVSFDSSAKCL